MHKLSNLEVVFDSGTCTMYKKTIPINDIPMHLRKMNRIIHFYEKILQVKFSS